MTSLCPRCRRPLEDDEPYICCAGVELRWRCADCHKVSEGFAFPYGMCPHCKGKLEMLDRGAIQGDEAMEAIRKAFEIELGGHAFYERASRESKDEELRELFGRFAGMEKEHMETLSKRYHAELPTPSADFQLDRAAIFAGVDRKPRTRPTCFASPLPSSSARWTSSPARASARRKVRSSASCTRNWPPRSASTSRC